MTLKFTDFFGGSGRAIVDGGFYLITPTADGKSMARKSDSLDWIWSGGSFETAALAEEACQRHFDSMKEGEPV